MNRLVIIGNGFDMAHGLKMSKILAQGIAYMVENRKKLLPFNPANGWGSYDGFVPWLIKYKEACEDNPGCKIRASI